MKGATNTKMFGIFFAMMVLCSFSCADKNNPVQVCIMEFNLEKMRDSLGHIIDSLNIRLNGSYGRDIELVSEPSGDSLLFKENQSEYIFGLATIQGYYYKQKRAIWDTIGEDCDCFVITSGPTELLNDFLRKIEKGNTVNFQNENGQVVMNIDLEKISKNYRTLILNSAASSTIKIRAYFKFPERTCVETCYSPAEIISAE